MMGMVSVQSLLLLLESKLVRVIMIVEISIHVRDLCTTRLI